MSSEHKKREKGREISTVGSQKKKLFTAEGSKTAKRRLKTKKGGCAIGGEGGPPPLLRSVHITRRKAKGANT